MSGRVVAAGAVAVEETIRTDRLPGQPGIRFGRRWDVGIGGAAALGAVAAAAVGAATRCVGVVGTDPAGVACRQHLARADVDVTTLLPLPGPTSRIVRGHRDVAEGMAEVMDEVLAEGMDDPDGAGELLLLPGVGWGAELVGVEHALARCEPGDVLLLDWSALEGIGPLVEAAYDLDLQIVALLAPYPLLPQGLDLRVVDVAVVDQRGASWLADAGELPGSLCVLVGDYGLSWDGETVVAPSTAALPDRPLDRAYAVLAGALAGRLACGDDRPEAAEVALAVRTAYETGTGTGPHGGRGPWPLLRLDLEELG